MLERVDETTIDDAVRTRAQPLPPEDRKAMILDAMIPLLLEHGRSVTSRQPSSTSCC